MPSQLSRRKRSIWKRCLPITILATLAGAAQSQDMPLVNGNAYRIICQKDAKAIDVPGNSKTNGINLQQWTEHNGVNQQWIATAVGSYWTFTNVNSGYCMEVKPASAFIDQAPYTGATNQQWSLQAVSGGLWRLANRASGLVLEVVGGSTVNDAALDQAANNNANYQQWSFLPASTIDSIAFGNTSSEQTHALAVTLSDVVTGGVSQTARRLLPNSPTAAYGGDLTFTMKCDPIARNYFSIKFYGSDAGAGRLILYCNGKQVGYRHQGDYSTLDDYTNTHVYPNRFTYTTTMLPLSMTQGQSSVTITIKSTGRISPYGRDTYANYQKVMDTPTRPIYRAYIHTDAFLDPANEAQGTSPTPPIRTGAPGSEAVTTVQTNTNNQINGKIASATTLPIADIEYIASAYSVSWSTGYHNATLVAKVQTDIDSWAKQFNTDNTIAYAGWGGQLSPLGYAISLLSPQLQSNLDQTIPGTTLVRRAAWSAMLKASRDYGRHNRQDIGNQIIACDTNIYKANKGLQAIDTANAFPETQAIRYLLEASGAQPYLGSDLDPTGSQMPYGNNFYNITPKGLTREGGYVSGYGEIVGTIIAMWQMSGDARLKGQAVKLLHGRAYMRYPMEDADGFQAMMLEEPISWRGDTYPTEAAYGDQWNYGSGMFSAAKLLDSAGIGYAKQMLADNQYFISLTKGNRGTAVTSLDVPQDYATISAQTDTGTRLPMADGQPDFAWADEQASVVVVKHGSEKLFVSPYWRNTGVEGLSKIHFMTAQTEHVAIVENSPQFTPTGQVYIRPDWVDVPYEAATSMTPPDAPHQAYAGELNPYALDFAGGSSGQASFYDIRYRNYLIGMNSSIATSYTMILPTGVTSALDLITGQTKTAPITVGPQSSVVLYLPNSIPTLPSAPRYFAATPGSGYVTLDWDVNSGASFTLKRGTASGGPYSTIATGLTGTNYSDTSVTNGTKYYYQLTSVRGTTQSYPSPEDSAQPLATTLPFPWGNTDIGAANQAGTASLSNGTFTIKSMGQGLAGNADGCQYAFQTLLGDGTITARIVSEQNTASNASAGVMIRESLASNSREVAMVSNPGGLDCRYRTSTGGSIGHASATKLNGVTFPYWVRLVRTGDVCTAYASPDGAAWTQTSQITLGGLSRTVYVGLEVGAWNTTVFNTSVFDTITLTAP